MTASQSGSRALEGLPKSFVTAMRTLFEIMDDQRSGFVKFSEIERRWQDDGRQGLPGDVLSSLRKVTPPDGYLSFDRFCAGLQISLLRNKMEDRGGDERGNNMAATQPPSPPPPPPPPPHLIHNRPPSAPLLDQESSGPPIRLTQVPPKSQTHSRAERTLSLPQPADPPPPRDPPHPPLHRLGKPDIKMGVGGVLGRGGVTVTVAQGPPKPPRATEQREGAGTHSLDRNLDGRTHQDHQHHHHRATHSLDRTSSHTTHQDRSRDVCRDRGDRESGRERGWSLERYLDAPDPTSGPGGAGQTRVGDGGVPLRRAGIRSALQTWHKERTRPVDHLRPEQSRTEHSRPEHTRSDYARPDQLRSDQLRSDQLRPDQLRPDQLRSDQLRSDQLRLDQLRPDQLRPDQLRPDQLRPDQLRPDQLRPDQLRPDQLRPDQHRSDQLRPDQLRSDQHRPDQLRPDQLRPDQLRSDHNRTEQLRSDYARTDQVRLEYGRPDPVRLDHNRGDHARLEYARPDQLRVEQASHSDDNNYGSSRDYRDTRSSVGSREDGRERRRESEATLAVLRGVGDGAGAVAVGGGVGVHQEPLTVIPTTAPTTTTTTHKKSSRKREPRRHTLQNGIDSNMLRRLKQLEAERDMLVQGYEVVERARGWYRQQLHAISDKLHYLPHSSSHTQEPSLEAQQEKLHFQLARIHEVNSHLQALMDASEHGLPAHLTLAPHPSTSTTTTHHQSTRAGDSTGEDGERMFGRLKEQNHLLTEEVSNKSERITVLEREKAALLRELFQARSTTTTTNNNNNNLHHHHHQPTIHAAPDSTFM